MKQRNGLHLKLNGNMQAESSVALSPVVRQVPFCYLNIVPGRLLSAAAARMDVGLLGVTVVVRRQ